MLLVICTCKKVLLLYGKVVQCKPVVKLMLVDRSPVSLSRGLTA